MLYEIPSDLDAWEMTKTPDGAILHCASLPFDITVSSYPYYLTLDAQMRAPILKMSSKGLLSVAHPAIKIMGLPAQEIQLAPLVQALVLGYGPNAHAFYAFAERLAGYHTMQGLRPGWGLTFRFHKNGLCEVRKTNSTQVFPTGGALPALWSVLQHIPTLYQDFTLHPSIKLLKHTVSPPENRHVLSVHEKLALTQELHQDLTRYGVRHPDRWLRKLARSIEHMKTS